MKEKSNSPAPSSIFVTTVDSKLAAKMIKDLKEQGFEINVPAYTFFAAKKKGVSCTFYQSGKLTVQGKEMGPFIEFYLEPEILGQFDFTYQDLELDLTPRIGIDESGKGDFFGPLCVAGVFAQGEEVQKLKAIGVRDSKLMTDAAILKVARKIRAEFKHHIVKINPAKYNELYKQFKNLNRLLAWAHATTIEQLVSETNCRQVIIDQFADEHVVLTALSRKKLELNLTQRHRGEEDLVVAAASILAREAFLEGLEKLGDRFEVDLPKGASAKTIQAGKRIVARYGQEALQNVGKLHFKTLDAILADKTE
jgi:ribonuclease HIII